MTKGQRRRVARRRKMIKKATPAWVRGTSKVNDIYREAQRLRESGENVAVDHIVPLIHPLVCGLHCPDNLRIICWHRNNRKGNQFQRG